MSFSNPIICHGGFDLWHTQSENVNVGIVTNYTGQILVTKPSKIIAVKLTAGKPVSLSHRNVGWQKRENRNYFKGADNVKRVQEWRKKNPGYWRRSHNALQDDSPEKHAIDQEDTTKLTEGALQDLLTAQSAVLVGLIATFTGDTLQDHIASTARNMQQLGNDILQSSTHIFQGGSHDSKAGNSPRPDT